MPKATRLVVPKEPIGHKEKVMKSQKCFAHTMLVLAILALASATAVCQRQPKDESAVQSQGQVRSFQPVNSLNGDPGKEQPQSFPLHESYLYDFCDVYSTGSCSGFQPQSGMIWDSGVLGAPYTGKLYGATTWGIQGNQYCPTGGFTGNVREIEDQNNYSAGSIYMWDPAGLQLTTLFMFENTSFPGWNPVGNLVQDQWGNLWGTLCTGGDNLGAFFKLHPGSTPGKPWPWSLANGDYYVFSGNLLGTHDGATPTAGFSLDMDTNNISCSFGCLYGTTIDGGANNKGTLYRVELPSTNGGAWTYSKINDFGIGSDAANPYASVTQENVNLQSGYDILYGTAKTGGLYGYGAVWEYKINESTGLGNESILYSFTGAADGANPVASLVEDSSGNLWGTTLFGGAGVGNLGYGTVFELSPLVNSCPLGSYAGNGWCETAIYTFTGSTDGAYPVSGLTPNTITPGSFFGTTAAGGNSSCISAFANNSGCGTVFWAGPGANNNFQQLYAFKPTSDGATPLGSVVMDSYGDLWGTTQLGGVTGSDGTSGGTIYELSCGWTFECSVMIVYRGHLAWPETAVGHAAPAQFATLTNTGTAVVKIGNVGITGDFQLVKVAKGGCSGTLNPGASCTVGATFNPTQTGLRTGQITITDSAQNGPQTVMLSGTGIN
jgi:uncharacterized repeat protein (TIGR03803 family)